MGCSSSHLLSKPNNPLQELQFKESQRERTRKQQEKQRKQIARIQKKQAKKQHKRKYSNNTRCSGDITACPVIKQRGSDKMSEAEIPLRYDFRREEFNRQLESTIQKQLNEDLCAFVLNQSTFAMQFFKNYESELSTISDDLLAKEKELNQNLEEHSILLTNPLDVAVAKWINYKPVHGPDKHHPQLLQTETILIVFENIDIARPNDANYDSISPLCKVDMEMDFRETTPCKEDHLEMLNDIRWKGYVRLRLREDPKQQQLKALITDSEDIYSEGSSGYSTASPYGSKTVLNVSGKMSADDGDQDYDYAFITHLNTLHPLKELKMSKGQESQIIDAKVLPDCCISTLGDFVQPLQEGEFTDDEDESESESDNDNYVADEEENAGDYRGRKREEDYRDYDTLQAIKLYRIELEKRRRQLAQNYLNSREFMRYFGELMHKSLAQQLQITDTDLDAATFRGNSIYTNKHELIPAIYVAQNVTDWPKCAFEFRLRDRPLSTNPQTGQQIQWPTRAMIKRIETFGFHVVPLGYAPKKRRNPFRDIEWRIVFPKAERYLEQHLTNAQIKVFMITKALLKSFVEPLEKNKSLMFALDHMRTHLFWECEKDYNAWPEEFLGDVLIRFIESFKRRVKEKRLPDYFIRERNLFESIPEYSLNTLYMILADITANPLMHLMIALRNLDFSDNFYPKLNMKKLYENLMENEMIKLKLLAKNGRSLMHLVQQDGEEESCIMPDEGAKGLVGLKQHHVRTHGKLRRKTHLLRHTIEMKKQEMEAKRRSHESIDVEFFFQKNMNSCNVRQINQGVENLRRTNILEILVDQLIAMSAKAIEYRSVMVAKCYISQARRLCKCYHNYGCDVGAKEYLAKIHNLDEELQIIYDNEDFSGCPAPTLPRRISMEPTTNANSTTEKSQRESADIKKETRFINQLKETEVQEKLTSTPEPRKCVKMCPSEDDIMEEENYTQVTSRRHPNSHDTSNVVRSVESRKAIKFRNVVIEVHEGDSNPLQKPGGYSPVSILRSKLELPENPNDSESDEEVKSETLANHQSITTSAASSKPKDLVLPSFLKSSADFLKSSPFANTDLFQNVSQNTNKFISHMSNEDKRSEIRQMLKQKTLQIKGVFSQSSDS